MDCDGPKHALIRDSDGRFINTLPSLGSIIPFAELRLVLVMYSKLEMIVIIDIFRLLVTCVCV